MGLRIGSCWEYGRPAERL